ncbi:MAG: ABC transporter permease [Chloroflexi bacterium]|nr:ABC transporter permease [Chloroflexota bacterium]
MSSTLTSTRASVSVDVTGRPRSTRWPTRLRLLRSPEGLVGATLVLLMLLTAAFAGLIAPFDPNVQDLAQRLLPPLTSLHPLGTDHLGRDIFSRILFGTRVALIVSVTAVLLSGAVGIAMGLVSGYFGTWIDDAVSWLVSVQLSFPFILLAIAVAAVLGGGLRNLIIVLALTGWVVYARVVRAEALSLRESDYVQAARALGASPSRILVRHILPNAFTPVIVIASFEMARMIVSEAALSFLGVGVEPSLPSWGAMLADGRTYLSSAWWVATFPGLAIAFTVLGANLLGDWLRGELDPRLNEL